MDPRVLAQRRVAQSQKERSILPTLAVACCVIVPIFVLVVHQRSSPPLRPLAIVTSMKPLEPLDDGEQATVLPSSGASVAALPLKPAAPASEEEMAQPAGLPRRRHKRLKPRRAGFEGGAYVAHTVESSNPPPPPAASASAATATAAVADHESGQAMAVLNRERLAGVGWLKTCGGLYAFLAGEVRRAPRFAQRMGFEWVWRVMQEPRRLAWRYFITSPHALLRMAVVREPGRRRRTELR
jgi:hypothetical protein